jgi:hypothetical protein
MFINVPKLLELIDANTNVRNSIYGKVLHKSKPGREKTQKNYLSTSEYPGTFLPDFCTGPSYLMTRDVVPSLFEKALNSRFMRSTEDVLVTGIAAQMARINLVHVPGFNVGWKPGEDPTPCMLAQMISFHDVSSEKLYHCWTYLRTSAFSCP